MVTRCCGLSSLYASSDDSGDPIRKLPAGNTTMTGHFRQS